MVDHSIPTGSSATRVPLAADDPRHGTRNGYTNLKCRCQPCRDAWAAYCVDRRSRRTTELAAGLARVDHGTSSTYTNWGCRCVPCTAAHTAARWGAA